MAFVPGGQRRGGAVSLKNVPGVAGSDNSEFSERPERKDERITVEDGGQTGTNKTRINFDTLRIVSSIGNGFPLDPAVRSASEWIPEDDVYRTP